MDSGIILIVVLIIIGFAITWSNQGQVKEIEKRQSQFTRERQAKHDNKSASEVDEERNSMIETLETSITDQPKQLQKMKSIINDWADMKIKSFKDRRSWVRNPDDIE